LTSSAGESSKVEAIFVMLFASSHSSLSLLCAEIEIKAIRGNKIKKKVAINQVLF
jgi:hypothetical protein